MNSTSLPATPDAEPLLSLEAYRAIVHPAITYLLIASTLGAVLVPLLIALIFFSTAPLRRQPIFIMNVIAILFGFALTFDSGRAQINILYSPLQPQQTISQTLAYSALGVLAPYWVECILLVRLTTIFPFHHTPRLRWIIIMIFPFAIKIGRIINIALSIKQQANQLELTAKLPPDIAVHILENEAKITAEWFLQIFDNAYSSCMFMWKLYEHGHLTGLTSTSTALHSSRRTRIITFFWLAATSFVFPVLFNITQIVVYLSSSVNVAFYLVQVNCYVCIIAVVFATVWCSGSLWAGDHIPNQSTEAISTVSFSPWANPGVTSVANVAVRPISTARHPLPPISGSLNCASYATESDSASLGLEKMTYVAGDCDSERGKNSSEEQPRRSIGCDNVTETNQRVPS